MIHKEILEDNLMKYTMQKFKFLIFGSIVFCFLSCTTEESCVPPYAEYPNSYNLDWENYNEVWDVFASNRLECSDLRVTQNNGKDIKVYGWLIEDNNGFTITNDTMSLAWKISIHCPPEIQTAISKCDLTQKCYLKGELRLEKIMDGKGAWCCQMGPYIILKKIDDICFE